MPLLLAKTGTIVKLDKLACFWWPPPSATHWAVTRHQYQIPGHFMAWWGRTGRPPSNPSGTFCIMASQPTNPSLKGLIKGNLGVSLCVFINGSSEEMIDGTIWRMTQKWHSKNKMYIVKRHKRPRSFKWNTARHHDVMVINYQCYQLLSTPKPHPHTIWWNPLQATGLDLGDTICYTQN